MTDLATDHEAVVWFVIEEHRRLERRDPRNPLLKYICGVSDDGFRYSTDVEIRKEFNTRYFSEGHIAFGLSRYYIDLRREVDKAEGIDREPKLIKIEPIQNADPEFINIPF